MMKTLGFRNNSNAMDLMILILKDDNKLEFLVPVPSVVSTVYERTFIYSANQLFSRSEFLNSTKHIPQRRNNMNLISLEVVVL